MKRYFLELPAHARLVAIALLAVSACIMVYIVITLASWFLDSQQRIYDLVPRIARLQGYELNEDRLRNSAEAVRDQLSELAYLSEEDGPTTGAAIQQQLRGYMERAGLSVSSSQLLSPQSHEGFEELRFELIVSGSMSALDGALLSLLEARPLLMLQSLELSPMRTRRRDEQTQTIIASLNISAVRLL